MDATGESRTELKLAAKCAFLRVTMGERPGAGLVNYCRHIVRDGRECVGPFLDDHETTCGLWEPHPPTPQPVAHAPGSEATAGEAEEPSWI